MSKEFENKMTVTSSAFNTMLDKALCESEFRWRMIQNPDKVLSDFGISDENDLEEFNKIRSKVQGFIIDRIAELDNARFMYKTTNPNICYEEALKRRH